MSINDLKISEKWPANNPNILQLYSLPTPNGVKVSIMLEELGVDYEAHFVNLNETTTPEFLSLNPNNKIPAIIDPDGPDGAAFALWESGAILIYLAEKYGKFLPSDPAKKYETIQWLMFQMGGVGPMMGQYNFFKVYGGKDFEDKRPMERYQAETKRLLSVLEKHLSDARQYIVGDEYTIADIALIGWVASIGANDETGSAVDFDSFTHVVAWVERIKARPAVQKGQSIPGRD